MLLSACRQNFTVAVTEKYDLLAFNNAGDGPAGLETDATRLSLEFVDGADEMEDVLTDRVPDCETIVMVAA